MAKRKTVAAPRAMAMAEISTGKQFNKSGTWAGQQFLKALNAGQGITTDALRTLDTLRKDEWVAFDNALVEEGHIRLKGIADLIAAGLTIPVPNALGKTIFQYEKMTDMSAAQISLDGMAATDDDRVEFTLGNLPLPIIHKDWSLNLRTLTASRERGEALDTTQTRVAGRLISEMQEYVLFRGYAPKFLGFPIYGYTSHPNRETGGFIANGNWAQTAKTGSDCLNDTLKMIKALQAKGFYGPYNLYVDSLASTKLSEDFKANGDLTIRERLLMIEEIKGITVADQQLANHVSLVQMTRDVVALVQGEPVQTIQWDIEGGFTIRFKGFCIQVPLVRSDDRSYVGVYDMS